MRIEEVCEVVVGETYDVPVVDGRVVTGVRHVDNDFFIHAPLHWHIDTRFEDVNPTQGLHGTNSPTRETRKCIQTTPTDFPQEFGDWALARLYMTFGPQGAACGVCPHKGMPIHNGICSGHRMRFTGDYCEFKPPFFFITNKGESFQADKIWDDQRKRFTFEFLTTETDQLYFNFVDSNGRFIRRLDKTGAADLPGVGVDDTLHINDTAHSEFANGY